MIRSGFSSGKEWAYVSRSDNDTPLGWVFRDYLNCDQRERVVRASSEDQSRCLVADPTGTPLNVRTEPNGRIIDTLPNGVLLTIIGSQSSHGKEWSYVSKADHNATLGWVFRDYLNCSKGGAEASRGDGEHAVSVTTSPDGSSPTIVQLSMEKCR